MKTLYFYLCWLVVTTPLGVTAQDLSSDRLSLNGFGTIGAAYNDSDDAAFIRDIGQADGVRDGWSGHVDSRLGLQVRFRASETLDLIGQAVSRYNYEGDYDPELTWAFMRYSPDPGIQLRLGRVGIDNYMLSDSKDVSYSYLWVRPPVDYYGNRHLTFIDGGDLTLKKPLGQGLGWVKVYAGKATGETLTPNSAGERYTLEAEADIVGGQLNYTQGPWHLQLAHSQLDYQLDPPSDYVAYLDQLRFVLPDLADVLSVYFTPVEMKLWSLALSYSKGPFQFQAAYNNLAQDISAGDSQSGFMTAGYRFGKITPYLSWSAVSSGDTDYRSLGLPIDGDYGMTQHTATVGARYDFVSQMALKMQFDRINVDDSGILWRDAAPGWNGNVSLFSVSLDFIF